MFKTVKLLRQRPDFEEIKVFSSMIRIAADQEVYISKQFIREYNELHFYTRKMCELSDNHDLVHMEMIETIFKLSINNRGSIEFPRGTYYVKNDEDRNFKKILINKELILTENPTRWAFRCKMAYNKYYKKQFSYFDIFYLTSHDLLLYAKLDYFSDK